MTKLEQVANNLMKPLNPSLILVLGIYTVTWGLWLISPFWTVFTQAPLYMEMARLAPEMIWGLFAVATGLLTLRGAMKPSYMNLHVGSFVAGCFWFVITLMYFVGDWTSTGGITSFTFFVYSALVFVNVKVNKHHYNRTHS